MGCLKEDGMLGGSWSTQRKGAWGQMICQEPKCVLRDHVHVLTPSPSSPSLLGRNPTATTPLGAAPLLPTVTGSRGPDPAPAGLARAAVRMGHVP